MAASRPGVVVVGGVLRPEKPLVRDMLLSRVLTRCFLAAGFLAALDVDFRGVKLDSFLLLAARILFLALF